MEIISAKYLLPMEGEALFNGAIAVENGEIIDVGKESDLVARYPDASREDYPKHVIMPGLVNAHTHLDMTLHKNYPFDPVRTLSADVNFVFWLLTTIDYKKKATPEQLRQGVEEGLAQCIESGTTCVGDMGSYDGIFYSLSQAGIRAVIFPEVLSYDSSVAKDLYETALAIVEKYMEFDSDLINVGIGPYSPYTLSRNILKIVAQYCRSSNLPIMMHAAESFTEMEFFYDSSGDIASHLFPNIGWGENLPPAFRKTPIEYLKEIDFLKAKPILVGCNHLTASDIDRLAESQSRVVWIPRSSDYRKLGRMPVGDMFQKNISIALATDGISSTNTLSLWDELRVAYEIAAHKSGITARDLLHMVTLGAAQVLDLGAEVGSLKPGKRADYIVVDVNDLPEGGDLPSFLIQNTKNYHIHKVVVNGRTLKNMN